MKNWKMEITSKERGKYNTLLLDHEYTAINNALLSNRPFFLEREGMIRWFMLNDIINVDFIPVET